MKRPIGRNCNSPPRPTSMEWEQVTGSLCEKCLPYYERLKYIMIALVYNLMAEPPAVIPFCVASCF